jgi:hypothetical protein
MPRIYDPPTFDDAKMLRDTYPQLFRVYADVHRERARAHELHDENGRSMERASWHDPRWLPVIAEELGEVARVICDHTPGGRTLEQLASSSILGDLAEAELVRSQLLGEVTQLAAMSCALLDALRLDLGLSLSRP